MCRNGTSDPIIMKGGYNFNNKEQREIIKIARDYYYSRSYYKIEIDYSMYKNKLELLKNILLSYKSNTDECIIPENIKIKKINEHN